jgi:hypothetical protein
MARRALNHRQGRKVVRMKGVRHRSASGQLRPLPKELDKLGESYTKLIRELAKR